MRFNYSKLKGRIKEKYGTQEAFAKAKEANRPTVINVNIFDHRPLPVEQLQLDSAEFEKEYQTQGLIPFSKLIQE